MSIKHSLLFIIQFFVSLFVYPNYKPHPGYYLSLNGDSVHCTIEFSNGALSPRTIEVHVNGSMKEFGPDDIKGFGVTGYGDYISSKVTYHTNPVSGEDLPENYSDNTETKSCFLKVLRRNVYSLYSLVMPERSYLFISSPDKSFAELVYRAKRSNDSLSEDQSYRNQMLALFANEGISQKYFSQISEVSYNGSAIGALVNVLNEAHTGVKAGKKTANLQMDVFAGILQNAFPTSFNGHYTIGLRFNSQISPTFGVNFLYPLPGKNFGVGLSLGYNGYNCTINTSGSYISNTVPNQTSTSVYNETITTKNSLLYSNLYLMYMINPAGRIRYYLKGGLNYYFSFDYNKNEVNLKWTRTETGVVNGNMPYVDHYGDSGQLITMKNYFISFKCAGGVNFGRSFLELSYSPPVQIAATSGDYYLSGNQTDFKFSSVGICFYFMLFH
jgi:hypothetical protein